MMQVMMYAVPLYLAGDGEMTPDIELLLRWASLAADHAGGLLFGGAVFSQFLA
jgi:hypothetical protein